MYFDSGLLFCLGLVLAGIPGELWQREQYWTKTSLCPFSPLNVAAGKKEVLVTMDREKAAWAVYHWDAGIPPDVGSHGAETHPMGPRSPPSSEIRPSGVSKASQRGVDNRDQLVACAVGQVSLVAQIIKNLPAMWKPRTGLRLGSWCEESFYAGFKGTD